MSTTTSTDLPTCLSSTTSTDLTTHPVAYFHPSHWGDYFLGLAPPDEATHNKMKQEVEQLKVEVKKELAAISDEPLAQLNLIDAIERLGVAYHFEKENEDALQQVYENYHDQCDKDDLFHVSTRFRILRQHGFNVPCGVFLKFKEDKGGFGGSIQDDVRGILSLYEASHVRIPGDNILDDAYAFTTAYLRGVLTMTDKQSSPLAEQIAHALHQPLHKGIVRLESKLYISFYEQDPCHNKILLKLAKLDFNLLQSMHQMELRNIYSWWKDFYSKVPFTRNRLVEAYFWVLGCYYEPEYALARKLFMKIFMIVQVFDDIFDAYGTYDILKMLVEAIYRWDKCYIAQLPEYFNCCYQELLEIVEETEKELAKEGKSYAIQHFKEQMNRCCQAWLLEAKWCQQNFIPTYDEYMKNAIVSIGHLLGILGSYFGMGPDASLEAYEWVCQDPLPKLPEASIVIFRLMNDLASTKIEQTSRKHVVSSVQCYMKENDLISDEEKIYQALEKKVEDAWKDLNQAMLRPYDIPKPLCDRILHITRGADVFYKGRHDGYTVVNQIIKDKIASVLVHPIPF